MKTTIIFLGLILFLTACEKLIEPLQPPRPALVTIVGASSAHTIIESTIRRFRPIVLTAAAAILAMIPLTRSFFGPMAVVIMGGLAVATLLTVLFLPGLV